MCFFLRRFTNVFNLPAQSRQCEGRGKTVCTFSCHHQRTAVSSLISKVYIDQVTAACDMQHNDDSRQTVGCSRPTGLVSIYLFGGKPECMRRPLQKKVPTPSTIKLYVLRFAEHFVKLTTSAAESSPSTSLSPTISWCTEPPSGL